MKKALWLPLFSSLGTMALLYLIGNMFEVLLLRFSFVLNEPLNKGLIFSTNISLLPFVIGLLVGFVVERSVKVKSKA